MLDVVRGCQVVIAVHIGPPMIASLTHLGVEVLGAPTESVDAALRAYQRSLAGGPPLEVLRVDPGTMHTTITTSTGSSSRELRRTGYRRAR